MVNSIRSRIELAKYFNQLDFHVGAEIGVADGRYSEILCKEIPGLDLTCVDPWAKYDGNWRSDDYQDKAFKKAQDRLSKYNVSFKKNTSLEAARDIKDGSLDFVFIDGAHDFNNVMLDLILWTPKVRKGGIVALHDYYRSKYGTVQVIPAVDTYTKINKIDFNITPRYEDGHKDDTPPCVWWVKK